MVNLAETAILGTLGELPGLVFRQYQRLCPDAAVEDAHHPARADCSYISSIQRPPAIN